MKRKQLKNSISGGLQVKSNLASGFLESAGIDPQRRAETLSLAEWGQLTRVIAAEGAV
jgi:16S rRNA (adenine1518-N6/adenine1519-N6)-dimethyltransferase